ncbi:MAG: methionine synthase [SAR202 cluster bacterium]|nr:methionine synthase [SAR202 cluster bacterium]
MKILDRLKNNEILIFDGATGTYLQKKGLIAGDSPEKMNIENPEIVKMMAKHYYDAGSDIVLTNSFGGNKYMLKKYGIEDKFYEVNRLAAELAKSVAPLGKYVCGSIGPTGEFLEPLGNISESEMYDVFTVMCKAFEDGGADAVMIETQLGLEEASLGIKAAKDHTNLTVMSTMVFDKGPRGYFTMMGVTPESAAMGLLDAGADIVGTNCGNGIEKMIEIATLMRQATDRYLVVQSNAGIPSIIKGKVVYPESPEFMAEKYKKLSEIPVNILGGCCGTTDNHIRALRNALN